MKKIVNPELVEVNFKEMTDNEKMECVGGCSGGLGGISWSLPRFPGPWQ